MKWICSHFDSNIFNIMANDIVESMSTVLKNARDEPIIPLLYGYQKFCMSCFMIDEMTQ